MTVLNPWSSFGLDNVLVPGSNQGQVIYVNSAANGALDTNSGLRPREAKLTIHGALAACTNYMMDTIVVLNYESATEINWPISVDVHGVRIVGAPGGGYMPRYTGGQIIDPADPDTAGMTLDASHIHISGFEFRVGASHGGIEFVTGGVSRHGIYNCVFTNGLYGIWATALSCPSQGPTIKNCLFVRNLTSDGIRYTSDAPFARIEDNVFNNVGGIAIHINSTASASGFILRNYIGLVSDAAARAIVFSANNHYFWIIADNQANYGTGDMDGVPANPYLDSSTEIGGVNHWLLNYRNFAGTLPA